MLETQKPASTDPFSALDSLQAKMDRLLASQAFDFQVKGSLLIDMYQDGNNLVVKASLPGIDPENVKIRVHNNTLTIEGEMKQEQERKEHEYYLHEQHYASFVRSVSLPFRVVADKAEAVYENGMLTLTLPKGEEVPAKQIPITAR